MRVKTAAKQFIERSLGANDLMAVVHTAGPSDANQEFTSNKRLLLAAVDKTHGRKLDSATANKTNEYNRTRDIRQQGDPLNDPDDMERGVQRAARRSTRCATSPTGSARVRGRRKAILFVSEGIDYDINDVIRAERLESLERVDGPRRHARGRLPRRRVRTWRSTASTRAA